MDSESLRKKVGQLFIIGVSAPTLQPEDIKNLSTLGVGGVVLFKHNYQSLPQLIELNREIQQNVEAHSWSNWPAWIAVDQEGGRVQRLSNPFTSFPPAEFLGKIQSPKTAFEVGFVMGQELKSVGIQLNFAPCIDVAQNPPSKAIGDRAISDSPEIVANVGSAFIRGIQKAGVLGVAKHFPGHGSVETDSHQDLPISPKTLEQLEALDWIPFRRLIRSKAQGIMTAHILFPQIDPDKPASLSRTLLRDSLRKQLRHNRLIFSDDLEMGAIVKKYSLKDAAFLAVAAGTDQILLCHEYSSILEVWEYLVKAFESGGLSENLLEESLSRIEAAKKLFLLGEKPPTLDHAQKVIGQPSHLAVADSVRQLKPVETGPSNTEEEDS